MYYLRRKHRLYNEVRGITSYEQQQHCLLDPNSQISMDVSVSIPSQLIPKVYDLQNLRRLDYWDRGFRSHS
jgi:hypothetical protein